MKHTQLDPLLFAGEKSLYIYYVDDFILWSWNESEIDDISKFLIDAGLDIEK